MSDEEQKKTEKPYRMSRIAWPNSKYGLYLAIIIIILFLVISYRHLIFFCLAILDKSFAIIKFLKN